MWLDSNQRSICSRLSIIILWHPLGMSCKECTAGVCELSIWSLDCLAAAVHVKINHGMQCMHVEKHTSNDVMCLLAITIATFDVQTHIPRDRDVYYTAIRSKWKQSPAASSLSYFMNALAMHSHVHQQWHRCEQCVYGMHQTTSRTPGDGRKGSLCLYYSHNRAMYICIYASNLSVEHSLYIYIIYTYFARNVIDNLVLQFPGLHCCYSHDE